MTENISFFTRRQTLASVGAITVARLPSSPAGLADPFFLTTKCNALTREIPEASGFHCQPAIPPVRDLIGLRFYTDPRSTIIDPKLFAKSQQAEKPVKDISDALSDCAKWWILSHCTNSDPAICGRNLLSRWAGARALLGNANEQGKPRDAGTRALLRCAGARSGILATRMETM